MTFHVTGGSGYLGSALCRHAPDASADRVEVRDAVAVDLLFRRLRPDAVIHTAYRQDTPDAWSVNVEGSENVARAARRVDARFVHVSTDVVFDGRKGAPYLEDDVTHPCTDYGCSKALAEERVAAAHPEALIVRTSLIVGGRSAPASKHERLAADPNASFYEDEVRSVVQVDDLALALLELVGTDVTGVLHAGGGHDVSRADLAELVTGRPVRRAPAPAGRPLDCSLDSSRARSLLRIELRGVRTVFA